MIDRTTTGGNVWGTTANTVVRPLEEIDREPLRITIENSVVKDAAGETGQLNRLQRYLTDNAPRPDQVEEVGLVTTQVKENDAWWRDRAHDHDCAHIALGNNYGKKDGIHCKCHMDMQMFRPTIWLDGIMVEKDGVFCDENLNGRPADMARRKADVEPQTGVNGMIVRKTSNMV